ncbi:MAG: hypothetical protein QM730_06540 [Anaerolineales bacterium]
MNNWVTFVLGLVLGIPIAYFVNLTTPALGIYLKNRSLSKQEQKIKTAINTYKLYKSYKANPITLMLAILSFVMGALAILGTMFMFSFIFQRTLFTIIGLLLLGVLYFMASRILSAFGYLQDFDKFREQAVKKLIKLGGNPEDLDKEETVVEPVSTEKKNRKAKVGA